MKQLKNVLTGILKKNKAKIVNIMQFIPACMMLIGDAYQIKYLLWIGTTICLVILSYYITINGLKLLGWIE